MDQNQDQGNVGPRGSQTCGNNQGTPGDQCCEDAEVPNTTDIVDEEIEDQELEEQVVGTGPAQPGRSNPAKTTGSSGSQPSGRDEND